VRVPGVAERADAELAEAARNVRAKIAAVIPPELRRELEASSLLIPPGAPLPSGDLELAQIRRAIRGERKLILTYRDPKGRDSPRPIRPLPPCFFHPTRVVGAWCELREGFRHFRTDRIQELTVTAERYPRHRRDLLQAWRDSEGIGTPADGN